VAGRDELTYTKPIVGVPLGTAPSVLNKSFTITADTEVPQGGGNGMLVTQGGRFGGWGLFMHQGKLVYHYNLAGIKRDEVFTAEKLTPGHHRIMLEFSYDGAGLGKGGMAKLSVDGVAAAQGRIRQTLFSRISLDETLDIGQDTGTPISEAYQVPFTFNGGLKTVTIELKPFDAETAEDLSNPRKAFMKLQGLQN
jgi:arylsulfatase